MNKITRLPIPEWRRPKLAVDNTAQPDFDGRAKRIRCAMIRSTERYCRARLDWRMKRELDLMGRLLSQLRLIASCHIGHEASQKELTP